MAHNYVVTLAKKRKMMKMNILCQDDTTRIQIPKYGAEKLQKKIQNSQKRSNAKLDKMEKISEPEKLKNESEDSNLEKKKWKKLKKKSSNKKNILNEK